MSSESEDQGFTLKVKSVERQRKQGAVPSPVLRESANNVSHWHGNDTDRGAFSKDREKEIMGTYFYKYVWLLRGKSIVFTENSKEF